jgi:hypothetical protein
VSAPNERARAAGIPPESAGRITTDGRRIYQMTMPRVIWWTWIVVIVAGLTDLAIQGHDWISLKFGFGLLTVTGLVYACTIWPRVVADDIGITVQNPFRRFLIPWGAVTGIFLADSVEVSCARRAPKRDKKVYSWALSSPRRARARAQLRGRQWDQGKRSRPSSYDRLPDTAKDVVKLTAAEVMARELAQLSENARSRSSASAGPAGSSGSGQAAAGLAGAESAGAATADAGAVSPQPEGTGSGGAQGDVMSARWAWLPLAAIGVPGVVFVVSQLIR